jgi:hypothetical protein
MVYVGRTGMEMAEDRHRVRIAYSSCFLIRHWYVGMGIRGRKGAGGQGQN